MTLQITQAEVLFGALSLFAAVVGYLLEWRRSANTDRVAAVEGRLATVENACTAAADLRDRVASLEAFVERMKRSL